MLTFVARGKTVKQKFTGTVTRVLCILKWYNTPTVLFAKIALVAEGKEDRSLLELSPEVSAFPSGTV